MNIITKFAKKIYTMEFNIDTFHPFVLNIGLAQHNAD